jgi:hypothetical protein
MDSLPEFIAHGGIVVKPGLKVNPARPLDRTKHNCLETKFLNSGNNLIKQ